MNTEQIVSIILPTFDRANLLSKAIQSVLGQSYKTWELLIWDDGSTDATKKIVDKFRDERIRYFYDINHGAAYARNRAIENAIGDFIAFLDSDDIWLNNKLAEQVKALDTHPEIDCIFSNFKNVTLENNKPYFSFTENQKSFNKLVSVQIDEDFYQIVAGFNKSIALGNYIATDTMMIRSDTLKRIGGFQEELRNSEDFELWWRMGLEGIQFAYHNKVLMTRYKPAGSLSSPSLLSTQNTLNALDICLNQTLEKEQNHLIPYLNVKYRNAWQNLILEYGNSANIRKTWNAFLRSLKYGFRLGSLKLLLKALLKLHKTS